MMKFIYCVCACCLLIACTASRKASSKKFTAFHFAGLAQGTTYHITYYFSDSIVKKQQFDSIFNSIDSSLSIYKPYSLISSFNNAEKGIEMDTHLENVVRKSFTIYRNTNGISDITVYPLVRAWGFGTKRMTALPDAAEIQSILPCVGLNKLTIAGNYLRKSDPCIKIDVNGIGQGYTVDVVADFLEAHHVNNYLVEVGGEIRVRGAKYPSGDLFQIGVESPGENEFEEPVIKETIQLQKGAVTTSGNYRRYYESDGKIISHLINPKTGYPLQNELISVTVVAKDAITADGYDNALMGMGLKDAFGFLSRHKELQAHFIYHTNDGLVRDTATAGFLKLLKK